MSLGTMNINKTIEALAAQVASLAAIVGNQYPQADAGVSFDVDPKPKMAVGRSNDSDDDPNLVRVHITDAMVSNRMTLPREIFRKSNRDSYSGGTGGAGGDVDDPTRSFVVVDGVKYYQTTNQGRSSKIQVSTFGAGAGQTVVFTRAKSNVWESVVKGKKGAVPTPVKASAPAKAKGKSAVSFQLDAPAKGKPASPKSGKGFSLANPAKAEAQTVSKGKAKVAKPAAKVDPKEAVNNALRLAVTQINENAAAGFKNGAIEQAAKNRASQKGEPYAKHATPRMFLNTKQHKALKDACEAAGISILATDKPLRAKFDW